MPNERCQRSMTAIGFAKFFTRVFINCHDNVGHTFLNRLASSECGLNLAKRAGRPIQTNTKRLSFFRLF
jgi:hypothetical protein